MAKEKKAKEEKAKKALYFKSALALENCSVGYNGSELDAEQIKAAEKLSKEAYAHYIEEK